MAIRSSSTASVRTVGIDVSRVCVVSHFPTRWPMSKGIVAQGDVMPNGGRLRAKVLLFKTRATMRAYWKRKTGHALGSKVYAVVNSLSLYRIRCGCDGNEIGRIDVDERYFCMMGFTVRGLTWEAVAHESVHAGAAFARRMARSWWDAAIDDLDEEAVAYPTGRIALGVVGLLNEWGYEWSGATR